ncbi:hypothetical protein [Arthrobacter sp. Rue61a]|nr:hypothetical protein [Arthrobacter sp. Rue61a]
MPSQIPESIHTIVYDFGGVVTAPLITGILSLSQRIDREVESIVASMSAPIERGSLGPLAALEAGDLTETEAVSIFCKRLELTPRDLH